MKEAWNSIWGRANDHNLYLLYIKTLYARHHDVSSFDSPKSYSLLDSFFYFH